MKEEKNSKGAGRRGDRKQRDRRAGRDSTPPPRLTSHFTIATSCTRSARINSVSVLFVSSRPYGDCQFNACFPAPTKLHAVPMLLLPSTGTQASLFCDIKGFSSLRHRKATSLVTMPASTALGHRHLFGLFCFTECNGRKLLMTPMNARLGVEHLSVSVIENKAIDTRPRSSSHHLVKV